MHPGDTQQGWAYLTVHREMFEWTSTGIKRMALPFNKSAIAIYGKNAIKKAWATMSTDHYLITLFPRQYQEVHYNGPNASTVQTLHNELMLKIFHAQVGVDLKEFEQEKLKKKSNSKVALRPTNAQVYGGEKVKTRIKEARTRIKEARTRIEEASTSKEVGYKEANTSKEAVY
jgi:hypothetical protein